MAQQAQHAPVLVVTWVGREQRAFRRGNVAAAELFTCGVCVCVHVFDMFHFHGPLTRDAGRRHAVCPLAVA